MASIAQRYIVGGVTLPRPFKIRRLGHFGFNVYKLAEGVEFYTNLLGFNMSDTLDFSKAPWFPKDADLGDPLGYFMRYGTDHHAFVLFNKKVMDHRADRKFGAEVTVNQITWQCGSLKEILDAHTYFEELKIPIQRVGRVKSAETVYRGARSVCLRCGAEHHSVGLFPKGLRRTLGLSEHTTCMSFGVEVGSYAQLKEAVSFLKSHGIKFVDSIPPDLYPGIDYSAFALDPDGHCIQLYYYMEQVGWDGRVRTAGERRRVESVWPETLPPLSDTYVDQVFQGPLG